MPDHPNCHAHSRYHPFGPCTRPAGHQRDYVLHRDDTGNVWGYADLVQEREALEVGP